MTEPTGTYNRDVFFTKTRENFGALNQDQVDGFNILLDYIDYINWHPVDAEREFFMWWNSYLLATVWHETATTIQPIEEYGDDAYLRGKPYYPYYGRGFVQLTWDYNYRRSDETIQLQNLISNATLEKYGGAVNQLNHPNQALDSEIAACNLFHGTHQGWYGSRLWTHLNNETKDYVGARYCVNVQDDAKLIAGYAESFEEIFEASWEIDEIGEVPDEPEIPDPPLTIDEIPTPTMLNELAYRGVEIFVKWAERE